MFQPDLRLLDKIIPSRRAHKLGAAEQKFRLEESRWIALKDQADQSNKKNLLAHEEAVKQ
jgi:hypothetical protein